MRNENLETELTIEKERNSEERERERERERESGMGNNSSWNDWTISPSDFPRKRLWKLLKFRE